MFLKIKNLIFGQSLKTEELNGEKFNVFWGLPILSSDAISSVAYAGEEILWVLIPVIGLASYKYMFYAALAIVGLLGLLVFSYSQTIDNYPHGGGSYIVSKENLGTIPSLIAASSLLIDYVLTVAVSTSAGTAAILSAVPSLLPYRVTITLIFVLLLSIGNLRGIRDSSRLFGIPTYIFMISIVSMIITGIVRVHVFGYVPQPIHAIPQPTGYITVFLFLKAFSAGCTALTGIEAVSDGIPNFEQPSQKNAKRVLRLLALVVLCIFGGISYLSTLYHAVPNPNVTVVSQIASQVFGYTFMYYVVQITTAIILIMAANTAFADLPLLLSIIAKDGFVPRQFAKRGKRLSFSNGIVLLALAVSFLVIVFKGETHALIALYAVGVFISFTLSQGGMLLKWLKEKKKGWRHKAFINGVGCFVTFCTVLLIGYTRFKKGAWIVCILIPIFVFVMLRIKAHYTRVAKALKLDLNEKPKKVTPKERKEQIIIPIDTLNKSFLKAYNYAEGLSENITVFHVSVDDCATEKLKKKWAEYGVNVPLVIRKSPYRSLVGPLVKYIKEEELQCNGETVTIVIPQFVVTKWWHNALHNQTAIVIKTMLLKMRNIVVITIPYVIEE